MLSIKELHKRVDAEIGGADGWWKHSTGEAFREAAVTLSACTPWDDDRIIQFLSGLKYAVADEYGD